VFADRGLPKQTTVIHRPPGFYRSFPQLTPSELVGEYRNHA